MRKKLLLALLLFYAAYLAGGAALVYTGAIGRLYFLPLFSIKGPDQSTFAADGPWLFYQGPTTVRKQIVPQAGALVVHTDSLLTKEDQLLTCHVTETGTAFSFPRHAFPATQPVHYASPLRCWSSPISRATSRGCSKY